MQGLKLIFLNPILFHLLCIIVGLLLPTVALLEHILVPRDQGSQVAHRDVSAHLNMKVMLGQC